MVKKIVEVPEGDAKIIFALDAQDERIDELSFVLHHQVFIEDLPDTPEKRVVELPEDVINQFKKAKEQSLSVFDFLMYKFTGPNDVIVTNNRLANWYLAHIDFVPKEDK